MGYDGEAIPLHDREYTALAQFIYERSGINLGTDKKELVKARLAKRLRHHKLRSYAAYYELLQTDVSGTELTHMLDAISTNVTSFFREQQHFEFMVRQALPEIIQRKVKEKKSSIRIWSSANATGEEVYSIAMTINEYVGTNHQWDIKILGTDISTRALLFAHKGVYDANRTRTIPPLLRDRYFVPIVRDGRQEYQVTEALSSLVVFRRLNLMRETFPFKGKFDIIFCRNVMIYFDTATQEKLVNKFQRYLCDNGYLFIGHSESLIGTHVHLKRIGPAIYKKVLA